MNELRKMRRVRDLDNNTDYYFGNVTPLEAMQNMVYFLNIKGKCNPTINKTDSGLHLWFMENGTVYATENY